MGRSTINQHRRRKDDAAASEHWMQTYWRPLMAIQYMITCLCDFVIFPVLWTIIQAKDTSGVVTAQWQPITLLAGGFYHMSMGAIIGISAWGRTKEKTDGGMQFPQMNMNQPYSYPVPQQQNMPVYNQQPQQNYTPPQPVTVRPSANVVPQPIQPTL